MDTTKVKCVVKADPTYTLVLNGKEQPGFRKVEQWEGLTKFQKGGDVVVVDEATGVVARISPKLYDKVLAETATTASSGAAKPAPAKPGDGANGAAAVTEVKEKAVVNA